MKRLVLKIVLFAMIIGIPFVMVNNIYEETNFWKSYNGMYELKYFPDGIQLLNLGNSHEDAGIRYKKYYNGVANNFAASAQPFYYSFQLLKNARESIEEDAVVLIPISYYDWYYDWENLFIEIETYNNRYYSCLRPWQMHSFDLDSYLECGAFPLLTAKENFRYVYNDISLPDVEGINEKSLLEYEMAWINTLAEWKYNSWTMDVMDLGENKDNIYLQNRDDLVELIDYCYGEGYTPVLL